MSVTLPPPLDRLVAAVNGGDTEAFLALFTADGVVDDWGRKMKGAAAIRKWSDREFIGANGSLKVTSVSTSGDTISFEGDWKSDFYSGASHFRLHVADDRVREMQILSG